MGCRVLRQETRGCQHTHLLYWGNMLQWGFIGWQRSNSASWGFTIYAVGFHWMAEIKLCMLRVYNIRSGVSLDGRDQTLQVEGLQYTQRGFIGWQRSNSASWGFTIYAAVFHWMAEIKLCKCRIMNFCASCHRVSEMWTLKNLPWKCMSGSFAMVPFGGNINLYKNQQLEYLSLALTVFVIFASNHRDLVNGAVRRQRHQTS